MRIFSGAALLALAACSGETQLPEKAEVAAGAKGNEGVACALAGATEFSPICAVEQLDSPEGLILTLHHPDGGFRRLQVTGDGRGVVSADGAEEALVTPIEASLIEVAISGDRYRLPATVKK